MALCVEQAKFETLYSKKSSCALYIYHIEMSSVNIQSPFWHLKACYIYIMNAISLLLL